MKQVVLDTNFLLIPYTLKVDIFSEIKEIMDLPYEICLLDESLNELNKILKPNLEDINKLQNLL